MAAEDNANQGKLKLFIIIAVIALITLGGGAAAFLFLNSGSSSDNPELTQVVSETNETPVSYVNIPQPFLFNVTGDKRDRLVQINVQLMVRGLDNENLARYHSPLLESSLLATFASATVEQLRSATGRIELRDKATEDVKASLTRAVGQPVIERVLFTDFVIQ